MNEGDFDRKDGKYFIEKDGWRMYA